MSITRKVSFHTQSAILSYLPLVKILQDFDAKWLLLSHILEVSNLPNPSPSVRKSYFVDYVVAPTYYGFHKEEGTPVEYAAAARMIDFVLLEGLSSRDLRTHVIYLDWALKYLKTNTYGYEEEDTPLVREYRGFLKAALQDPEKEILDVLIPYVPPTYLEGDIGVLLYDIYNRLAKLSKNSDHMEEKTRLVLGVIETLIEKGANYEPYEGNFMRPYRKKLVKAAKIVLKNLLNGKSGRVRSFTEKLIKDLDN